MPMEKCPYCDRDGRFRSLLFEVCRLRVSTVFLCKDQTLPGRCTIMYRDHCAELCDVPEEERNWFMQDVCDLQEALIELFRPDKLNTAYYGDLCRHVHFTVCPKYRDRLGWGGPFVNFPSESDMICLSEKEYLERITQIRTCLMKKAGIYPQSNPVDRKTADCCLP